LGTYTPTTIQSFFPFLKSTMEVIFLNAVKYCLHFPLVVRQFQNIVHSVSFSIWETKRNHTVVMKEAVVVAPKFQSSSSHIFIQASQNVSMSKSQT
jgi:hypothetical protein